MNEKNSNMIYLNLIISIIVFNVNDLNISIKRQDYQTWSKTNKTYPYAAYKKGSSYRLNKDLNRLKGKGQAKIYTTLTLIKRKLECLH